jgi:hypothetical protein
VLCAVLLPAFRAYDARDVKVAVGAGRVTEA